MDISQFGKGALPDKKDKRDFRLEVVAGAFIDELPAFFSVREKIGNIKAQGRSLSCVGQSLAYYVEVVNMFEEGVNIQASARDIYSKIFQSQGGAYVRDGMKKIADGGVVEEADATSYEQGKPPSEEFMRKRDGITEEEEEKGTRYLIKSYFTWGLNNYEMFKRAIFEGKGCVIVAFGNNDKWKNAYLEVPGNNESGWYHAIFATGWIKKDGKEYIEFVNSWGNVWGENGFGYMPKEYFEKGFVPTAWTIIDLPNDAYPKIQAQFFLIKEQVLQLAKKVAEFIFNIKK